MRHQVRFVSLKGLQDQSRASSSRSRLVYLQLREVIYLCKEKEVYVLGCDKLGSQVNILTGLVAGTRSVIGSICPVTILLRRISPPILSQVAVLDQLPLFPTADYRDLG